jgi:hypothetical protein
MTNRHLRVKTLRLSSSNKALKIHLTVLAMLVHPAARQPGSHGEPMRGPNATHRNAGTARRD